MTVINRNESKGSSLPKSVSVRVDNPGEQKAKAALSGGLDKVETASSIGATVSNDPAYEHLTNIGRAISTAQSALSAVSDLRDKQYELAENAADSPNPEQRTAYQTEFDNIQTEISRVQSAATFNGVNVVQEKNTYDLKVVDQGGSSLQVEDTTAIVTGVSQSLFGNYSLSLSSSSGAATAEDTLDEISRITRAAVGGLDSAYGKANSSVRRVGVDSESTIEAGLQVRDAAEGEALANKVASSIAAVAGNDPEGEATKQLIEAVTSNLEPDRVKDLLSDG
jgi:flagellin-like hook-associated protein FlgL